MSLESKRNKKTTIKFWEQVLNDQKFDLVPELLSPDYKFNGTPTNAAQTIGWVTGLHKEMPDLHFTIETILAEDDKVALRWRLTATDPATKKKSYNLGTNIIVFKDGQAVTNDQGGGDKFVAIPDAPSAPAPK
jgi:predicted SnoaL-like aldol condensation-catalyzing enzyme